MKKVTNVLISGVGGQGVLLSSRVIGISAIKSGLEVKISEIHGLAQRGGSVDSHVRFGKGVHSGIIPKCKADYLLAFEPVEGLRRANYLSTDGIAIVNEEPVHPVSVSLGSESYPEIDGVLSSIREFCSRLVSLNATTKCRELAEKYSSGVIPVNTYLLGVLASQTFPIEERVIRETISEIIPEKAVKMNLEAFDLGVKDGKSFSDF